MSVSGKSASTNQFLSLYKQGPSSRIVVVLGTNQTTQKLSQSYERVKEESGKPVKRGGGIKKEKIKKKAKSVMILSTILATCSGKGLIKEVMLHLLVRDLS